MPEFSELDSLGKLEHVRGLVARLLDVFDEEYREDPMGFASQALMNEIVGVANVTDGLVQLFKIVYIAGAEAYASTQEDSNVAA